MSESQRSVPEPVAIAPPDGVLLMISNVDDEAAAQRIAHTLVDERLAACVNLLPGCRSVYRWEGAIEQAQEVTLLIKTSRRRHAACQQRLKDLHPYQVPEIVTVAPDAVWPAYASWVLAQTRPARMAGHRFGADGGNAGDGGKEGSGSSDGSGGSGGNSDSDSGDNHASGSATESAP